MSNAVGPATVPEGTNGERAAFYLGPERLLSANETGTSFPWQWHHREQKSANRRELQRRRLPSDRCVRYPLA